MDRKNEIQALIEGAQTSVQSADECNMESERYHPGVDYLVNAVNNLIEAIKLMAEEKPLPQKPQKMGTE